MKAIELTRPGTLALIDRPEPTPGAGEALIAVDSVGICGTDVKIHAGQIPISYPRIPGHEVVGRVIEPGSRGIVPVGTRVLIDPAIACGTCRECRADRPNLCPHGALMGRDVDGAMVERLVVDELRLHPIPDVVSAQAANLLQVLGTCVHAQDVSELGPGLGVVVGLGVAGMLHLQLLRARGRRVVGIARSEGKRAAAMRLDADAVAAPEDAERVVTEWSDGEGAALVVEAVGTVDTLAQAIRLCAPGGTVIVFGTITDTGTSADFPWYELYHRQIRLMHPRAAVGRDYDAAIDLAVGGVRLEELSSRSYPLADAQAAFEDRPEGRLKVTVTI